jgi:peptidoglycan/xylan/chitin deacetylase (PgdA/CDA1 family)
MWSRTEAGEPDAGVDILMYHSISDAPGPTSISPEVFREQLEILATTDHAVVSLQALADWQIDGRGVPPRAVVITFDDGFADFADHAWPELDARGWPATVFLPTGKIGGREDWAGANARRRPLLDWPQVVDLAHQGVDFAAHSVTHPDLTRLPIGALEREVRQCRDHIEACLGRQPISFAPPYGRSNPRVRAEIRRWYRLAVGTRLQRAGRRSDAFDLPRIEMHYFRNPNRWRGYLERREHWYIQSRRALRGLRKVAARERWR